MQRVAGVGGHNQQRNKKYMSIEHVSFLVYWMERLSYVTCKTTGKIVAVPALLSGPVRGIRAIPA
jgi:hypothetical protein